ncbi:hypothetical protein C8R44DRAFT_881628 [Mycena epipterygia]|nr:hypothetical protein C8R44DRAFT_881628 [Mycena epipterygia]
MSFIDNYLSDVFSSHNHNIMDIMKPSDHARVYGHPEADEMELDNDAFFNDHVSRQIPSPTLDDIFDDPFDSISLYDPESHLPIIESSSMFGLLKASSRNTAPPGHQPVSLSSMTSMRSQDEAFTDDEFDDKAEDEMVDLAHVVLWWKNNFDKPENQLPGYSSNSSDCESIGYESFVAGSSESLFESEPCHSSICDSSEGDSFQRDVSFCDPSNYYDFNAEESPDGSENEETSAVEATVPPPIAQDISPLATRRNVILIPPRPRRSTSSAPIESAFNTTEQPTPDSLVDTESDEDEADLDYHEAKCAGGLKQVPTRKGRCTAAVAASTRRHDSRAGESVGTNVQQQVICPAPKRRAAQVLQRGLRRSIHA